MGLGNRLSGLCNLEISKKHYFSLANYYVTIAYLKYMI